MHRLMHRQHAQTAFGGGSGAWVGGRPVLDRTAERAAMHERGVRRLSRRAQWVRRNADGLRYMFAV